MGQVFISYSRQDTALATAMRFELESSGFDVWWDDDVAAGRPWQADIETALRALAPDHLFPALRRGEVHVGFTTLPVPSDLEAQVLGGVHFVTCVGRGHPLYRRRKPVEIETLHDDPIPIERAEVRSGSFRTELKTLEPGRKYQLVITTVPPLEGDVGRAVILLHTADHGTTTLRTIALAPRE